MQILIMLLFLLVWLLMLWIGSIALESTGLERAKARFQALSALTGTGFTTSQSELIVEDAGRRKIISWLILLGNTGIMAFILLVILYTRAGLTMPSIIAITIVLTAILMIYLSLRLGLVDYLTTLFVKTAGKKKAPALGFSVESILYQAGEYAIAIIAVGEKAGLAGLNVKDISSERKIIKVMIIEKDTRVILNPDGSEKLNKGDRFTCYGHISHIDDICRQSAW